MSNADTYVRSIYEDGASFLKSLPWWKKILYKVTGSLKLWARGYNEGWKAAKGLYDK